MSQFVPLRGGGAGFTSRFNGTSLSRTGGPGFTSSGCDENSSLTYGLLRGIPVSACLYVDTTLPVFFIFTFGGWPLFFLKCSSSVVLIPVSESIFNLRDAARVIFLCSG